MKWNGHCLRNGPGLRNGEASNNCVLARLQLQDFRHAATVEFDTRLSIMFLAVRVFLRCGLLLVLVIVRRSVIGYDFC